MDSNNASVLNMSGSLMATDTYETTSNPPGSIRSFSMFGDSACGEPLLAQHLVLDFTPNEEVDTDYVQKKVCAFWEFVNLRPELQSILVLPETDLFKMSETNDILPDIVKHHNKRIVDENVIKERTAVSMLKFVEEKGLIDRTFESRLPQSLCSLGSRQYHENELPMDIDKVVLQEKEKIGNTYEGQIKYSKRTQTIDFHRTKTNVNIRNMCKSMKRWDELHPKSMQCPRNPHNDRHRQKKAS